jgi:hypothetical protein
MSAATRIFEPSTFQFHVLNEEHSEIQGSYARLEGEILAGRGMPAIVESAERLVLLILLHFIHEERFLETVSRAIMLSHRDANLKTTARLVAIEDGLKQRKPAAVLQLLLLVKVWCYWHMWTESVEFECVAPLSAKPRGIRA